MDSASSPQAHAYADRADAGRRLGAIVKGWGEREPVVLGIPRGGVPVAAEVAKALGARLDVILVRKIGVPYQPEVAMGAIGEGGFEVLDRTLIARAGVTEQELAAARTRAAEELDARIRRFRGGRSPLDLRGRTAVVVDDGLATGASARIACAVARSLGAESVILAVPVGPIDAERTVPEADEVICPLRPTPFLAVGNHYRDFRQTSEQEVLDLLGW